MSPLKTVPAPHLGRGVKFGRLTPTAKVYCLHISQYLLKLLPAAPLTCDYSAKAMAALSRIYMNDQLGDCVIAGGAHVRGVTSANAGSEVEFTDQQIVQQYSAIGGYDPRNPNTDRGCQLTDAMAYWARTGFPDGEKLAGYLAVDATNAAAVKDVLYLFENIYLGISLPDLWVNQEMPQASGFVWDVAGPPDPQNGHCICAAGYDAVGVKIATWGLTGTLTWAALAKYAVWASGGECYVLLSPDMIGKAQQKAPNGLDWSQLVTDFDALGGNLPVPPDPTPITTTTTNTTTTLGGPPVPDPTPLPPVPSAWQAFIAYIELLLKSGLPFVEPMIAAWVSTLPLPAAVIAVIEALLQQYLGHKATFKYKPAA